MLLVPAFVSAQDSSVVQVSLDEAVRRSLDVQPLMVQARGEQTSAGAQKRAAVGSFLPSVTLNSGTFRQNSSSNVNGFPVDAGEFQYTTSANIRWDVFTGFRRWARYRAADASQDAAQAGLVKQRFQVTFETKQLFYDALAKEDLVRVQDAQVRRARQQLQIAVEKLRAGSATRSDSLRATVDHGNARIQLLEAQANLATAQAKLGRQIGVPERVRPAPDTSLPAFPDTIGLRAAAATAPSVAEAEANAREQAATVNDNRSLFWPTLNVQLSTSSQGITQPWDGFDNNRNQNRLSLSLEWTLFNGFTRERQITDAVVLRDNRRATAADEMRRVSAAFTEQLAALSTSYLQIEISQATLAAATEDLRVQQERYRVGAATILDLLTSQAALTEAEQGVVQRRLDYLVARAQLEALVGRPL